MAETAVVSNIQYFLIDATPEPNSGRVDRTGVYDTVQEANRYLALRGPPLPIIIQFLRGQDANLQPLVALIKSVPGGNSNALAQTFVKGVISKIDSENLQVWPDNKRFYVLLNATNARKYISQHWNYISDVSSGTNKKTPSFPTFVEALIFGLAAGNFTLGLWGLRDRWGWPSGTGVMGVVPLASTSSANVTGSGPYSLPNLSSPLRVLGTQSQAPPSSSAKWKTPPQSPTVSQLRGPKAHSTTTSSSDSDTSSKEDNVLQSPNNRVKTAKGRGLGFQLPFPTFQSQDTPGFRGMQSPSTRPASSKDKSGLYADTTSKKRMTIPTPPGGIGELRGANAEQPGPFCIPPTLIPPSLWESRRFLKGEFPVVCCRDPASPGVSDIVWSTDPTLDKQIFLHSKSSLPPFVEFTLRAIGWGTQDMLRLVQVAWSSEGTRDAFILTLGEAGMPLSEAYLVWKLLGREDGHRDEEL